MIRGTGRVVTLGAGLLTTVLTLACDGGGGAENLPSGAWGPPKATSKMADGSNRGPEILSLRFEPEVAVPGRELRVFVDARDLDQDPIEFEYVWKIGGKRFISEGASISVPQDLPRDVRISVEVSASDAENASEPLVASTQTRNRAPRMKEIGIRVITGSDGDLGEWVADPVAQDPEEDEVVFRYEWRLNGERVVGESERLSRNGWKRGDEIRLSAWASDGESEGMPLRATPFTVGNSPPDIVSRPPGLDASGRFKYRVEATDRDGDRGLRFSLNQGPSGMGIDPFSGEVRWQATAQHAGEHLVEIEVDDRRGGRGRQSFYVEVKVGPGSGSTPAAVDPG